MTETIPHSINIFVAMAVTMTLQINMLSKSLGLHHEPSHSKQESRTQRKKQRNTNGEVIQGP